MPFAELNPLETPLGQAGLGVLSLILTGVITMLVRWIRTDARMTRADAAETRAQIIGVISANNEVVGANSSVAQKLCEKIERDGLVLQAIKDQLLMRPCMADLNRNPVMHKSEGEA